MSTPSKRGRKPLSQDVLDTTARLYGVLGCANAVGRRLGITGHAVTARLKRAGIPTNGKTGNREPRTFVVWTPADIRHYPEA